MQWTDKKINEIVTQVCAHLEQQEVLSNNKDKLVIRYFIEPKKSLIIKLWSRPHLGGKVRQLLNDTLAKKEWSALNHAHNCGINVPKVFGWSKLIENRNGFTEALVMEDIGQCRIAADYIKECYEKNDLLAIKAFENSVINMTRDMIKNKILDIDHTLINIVLNEQNAVYRIDFELAKPVFSMTLNSFSYGEMLGRLLASYTFAISPNVEKVPMFFNELQRILPKRIPFIALWRAKRQLKHFMKRHEIRTSIKLDVHI